MMSEYSANLPAEVRSLINVTKAIANQCRPSLPLTDSLNSRKPSVHLLLKPTSRLPDIPLPQFNGDFQYWPTFRDRFHALVDDRVGLSQFDKMYYLIGCLQGPASEDIPASAENYNLAWSTLATRFHRPRMVATSLLDKLLNASVSTQESLHYLNFFLSAFDESICFLKSLDIPDLGSFILFYMAFRCLPLFNRKLFESTCSSDYPTMTELLDFVRSHISILENVGDVQKSSGKGKPGKHIPMAMVIIKPTNSSEVYPRCKSNHALDICTRFQSLSVDDRNKWSRDHYHCFICLSDKHWFNKCQSKTRCSMYSRKHSPWRYNC